MIAADTSTVSAFLAGRSGADVETLARALADAAVCLPPVVLTELLSQPKASEELQQILADLPVLTCDEMFWVRSAELRRDILRRGLRARLGDTLVAQSCIDHNVPLATRDDDFRHFVAHGALRLAC